MNKKAKVIKVSETTSIELPAQQLTPGQMIMLQCEAIRQLSEIHLQQSINMGKLIDLLEMEWEARNPQMGVQRLLKDQTTQKRLN